MGDVAHEIEEHTLLRNWDGILRVDEEVTRWVNSKVHNKNKVPFMRSTALNEQLRLWVIQMWDQGYYVIQKKAVHCGLH